MFRSVWMWIKAQGPALLAIERIVLTIAGLSGLLVFWQFWAERDDRRLERMSSLIVAINTCDTEFRDAADDIIASRNPLDPKVAQSIYYRAAAVTTLMCHELDVLLASDAIAEQFDDDFWRRVFVAQLFKKDPELLEYYRKLDATSENED
ncbi:hypothetical protein [Roseivivax jejudonensis]|uniref:hypothetical protein n=1 Tax=Roseivivax jejudonensis TaxID=1529041 RepID=UPI000A26BA05|nr:hypothetical protein [Roseivivax jejudonensis]